MSSSLKQKLQLRSRHHMHTHNLTTQIQKLLLPTRAYQRQNFIKYTGYVLPHTFWQIYLLNLLPHTSNENNNLAVSFFFCYP